MYILLIERYDRVFVIIITDERIYFWTFEKSVVKKAANSIR